jgi:hypothetical protein
MRAGLTITGGLREVSARLDRAAALGRAALACAEGGAEDEAVRITHELDLDQLIGEAATLLAAVSLMQRMVRVASGEVGTPVTPG